jgi:hypothetical protein
LCFLQRGSAPAGSHDEKVRKMCGYSCEVSGRPTRNQARFCLRSSRRALYGEAL